MFDAVIQGARSCTGWTATGPSVLQGHKVQAKPPAHRGGTGEREPPILAGRPARAHVPSWAPPRALASVDGARNGRGGDESRAGPFSQIWEGQALSSTSSEPASRDRVRKGGRGYLGRLDLNRLRELRCSRSRSDRSARALRTPTPPCGTQRLTHPCAFGRRFRDVPLT
jgi:hypothetical protein